MFVCARVCKGDTYVPTRTTVHLPATATNLLSRQFQEGKEKQTPGEKSAVSVAVDASLPALPPPLPTIIFLFL